MVEPVQPAMMVWANGFAVSRACIPVKKGGSAVVCVILESTYHP
jgi:hypothetical protein